MIVIYSLLNLTKICTICPIYHQPVPPILQNSAETGKFRVLAQNSAFCGKLWSLCIACVYFPSLYIKRAKNRRRTTALPVIAVLNTKIYVMQLLGATQTS